MLQSAFRPSCMNRALVFEWHKRFKEAKHDFRRAYFLRIQIVCTRMHARTLGAADQSHSLEPITRHHFLRTHTNLSLKDVPMCVIAQNGSLNNLRRTGTTARAPSSSQSVRHLSTEEPTHLVLHRLSDRLPCPGGATNVLHGAAPQGGSGQCPAVYRFLSTLHAG